MAEYRLELKAHRAEYGDRLTAIRHQGHWERWLMVFRRGVAVTAQVATCTAHEIVALRDARRGSVTNNAKALALLDHLFRQPTVSVNRVAPLLACTFASASKLVRDFDSCGWLQELTGYGRNLLSRDRRYVDLFRREALDALVGAPSAAPGQLTGAAD